MTGLLVDVLIPSLANDLTLTYVSGEQLSDERLIGSRVLVPVRRRREVGVVVRLTRPADVPSSAALKEIHSFLDPVPAFEPSLMELLKWVSGYYLTPLGDVVRASLPASARMPSQDGSKTDSIVSIAESDSASTISLVEKRAPRQGACLGMLAEGPKALSFLRARGIDSSVVGALLRKGLVKLEEVERYREPFGLGDASQAQRQAPTPAQAGVISRLSADLQTRSFLPTLLHGVTGSGKTLVYIDLIEQALVQGLGSLVLIPEISLTPQAVRHFGSRFGKRIAVLHSRLSSGERYDAWRQVLLGDRRIVIGARSAVFAPVRNLGLIIVDEEHDGSYKQEEASPRYNARDVALMRGKLARAVVLLGSATPSLESYSNATAGRYRLETLAERIDGRPLPSVRLVDMRRREMRGDDGIISPPLRDAVAERLEKGEQVILLLNRRGHSTFIQCQDCGFRPACSHCQVAKTYHSAAHTLLCHYCGSSSRAPSACPSCLSHDLHYGGTGTQRVETALATAFPGARVIRMDADTTRRKNAHHLLLDRFGRGEADILLGTQMVAKGLDFPDVTLVGVISADTGLNLPDFRAGERTFQLLTQVAGRSGRGATPGEVVIQTLSPDDDAIVRAKTHDFVGYAGAELAQRREAGYPPFGRLILVLFRGTDDRKVLASAQAYADALRRNKGSGAEILGPAPAPIAKIKDRFRRQLLLKSGSWKVIHDMIAQVDRNLRAAAEESEIQVCIDADPLAFL